MMALLILLLVAGGFLGGYQVGEGLAAGWLGDVFRNFASWIGGLIGGGGGGGLMP